MPSQTPTKRHPGISVAGDTTLGREYGPTAAGQTAAAGSLCDLGRADGIDCTIVAQSGNHDWPFAAALPWLAGRLDTPGIARIPLPSTWPASSGRSVDNRERHG